MTAAGPAARAPLAVSMGEPAGIGPDIILRIHSERAALGVPPFVVYGDPDFFRARAARLGLDVPVTPCSPEDAAFAFGNALPVVAIAGNVPDLPGEPTADAAGAVIEAIRRGVADSLRGACRGLVTAPIHKGVLYASGFAFPGHTEFLAALCSPGATPRLPVMMLAHEELRVVPATIHVPVAAVPGLLTRHLLEDTLRIVAHDLRTRFGVDAPRIGVAGLNPHAGEGGTIGREDADLIAPALEGLRREGLDLVGPLPADTLFYPPHWRQYDAVVAMYHDQALIPIKTVAFEEAVNVTLGLPIVRTSPDHGTAFDLAGTGRGSIKSFLAALRLADRMTAGAFLS